MLSQLRTSALKKHARSAGADMDAVEAAADEDDKPAIVALIIAAEAAAEAEAAEAADLSGTPFATSVARQLQGSQLKI